ncbi:MAG: AEC family transporter [Clostridia bacterium]|nr:AEC family transporter [Clostridia bacterium]
MSSFLTALITVGIMLFYAVPGYLLVKSGLVKGDNIPAFARLLMYVCQPMLVIYSFYQVDFSLDMVKKMVFAFLFILIAIIAILLIFTLVFKKKQEDTRYRIYVIATSFSNCAFMGVPVLQALLPDYPEAVAFSAMFSLAMNIVGWSFASFLITRDKRFISPKKIFLNPCVISLVVAIPLFISGLTLPTQISDVVTLLAKMTTPLCMLIMGMRLACASLKSVVNSPMQYLIIAIKQLIVPLLVLVALIPFPVEPMLKQSIFIMFACPVASVVLNLAEMLENGQETSANLVLLGTGLSVITLPVMCLLI